MNPHACHNCRSPSPSLSAQPDVERVCADTKSASNTISRTFTMALVVMELKGSNVTIYTPPQLRCASSAWRPQPSRSITIALAPPPPLQMPAAPTLPPFCWSTWSSVTTIRAPLAPIGCPRATAPPLTLTFSGSRLSSRLLATETTEKASLISKKLTSSRLMPACAAATGRALAGAVVNHSGSCSASPYPRTVASTLQPCFSAAARDISTMHAAPSEIVEALAAVTVPSFLKAARPSAAGRGGTCGSSSMVTSIVVPRFLPGTLTGTISSAKRAALAAARARR
mmetsp:Transcript_49442/g.128977  ORF Transcript_49442/g.128977 Transcript_49442/m.128977 type:complete len:283 (+) Transcript_49442:339-1187(+)